MPVRPSLKNLARRFVPILILLVSGLIGGALIASAPEIPKDTAVANLPAVNTISVEPRTVQVRVRASGTVQAGTETAIAALVTGRIIWISPSMVAGGFFQKDELLIKIDARNYEANLARAMANLQRQESNFKNASLELDRIRGLSDSGVISPSELDGAYNNYVVAEADLRTARIDINDAERELADTEIRAPYDGRVRDERVDLGELVDFRDEPIATVYSTDFAEVRLPIPDYELKYLAVPMWSRTGAPGESSQIEPLQHDVQLRANFAGAEHLWNGKIIRIEGEIDAETRMVNLVARVDSPYERQRGRPPLTIGLFVDAEILGIAYDNVVVVPRSSLRNKNQILIVDENNRLRFQNVAVLRVAGDRVLVKEGLKSGDRVVVSGLNYKVAGMKLAAISVPVGENGLPEDW